MTVTPSKAERASGHMTDVVRDKIALQGFTKEAQSLVREAEELGWTFRRSTHGVVGQAPDGETTMSVGRKSSPRNRAFQNARAALQRWKRSQGLEVGEEETVDLGVIVPPPRAKKGDTATVALAKPWKTSSRVTERLWSDGRIDYVCTYPGCGYTAFKARAVSGHYGTIHTQVRAAYDPDLAGRLERSVIGARESAASVPDSSEPGPDTGPEPEPEAIAGVSETVLEPEPVPAPEPEPVVEAESPSVPLPDSEALAAAIREFIQSIIPAIAGPLVAEREELRRRIMVLEQERDSAVARMTKMKHDLKALSGLLDEID